MDFLYNRMYDIIKKFLFQKQQAFVLWKEKHWLKISNTLYHCLKQIAEENIIYLVKNIMIELT